MFSNCLIFFASIAAASALAVGPTPDASPTLTVCVDSLSPRNGCVDLPIINDECINFTNGLDFWNDEISNAFIPDGFICAFFDAAGCIANTSDDIIVLQGGTWDFFHVPGLGGDVNFNDRASSFVCSPS
ncbi:hypothetical protein C8J57DRAFT_1464812 [Mycena rebaudengoi]|nr:hypothetical protein C8J57DRAFT_1464812 [Mycena rebaudengoi]